MIIRPRVFMSHAREDADLVHKLAMRLSDVGIETWVDTLALRTGDRVEEIMHAIDSSSMFFAFVTPHYIHSQWCSDELVRARAMRHLMVAMYADSSETRAAIPREVLGDVVCGLFRDVSYQKKIQEIIVRAYDSLQVASVVVPADDHILASPGVFDRAEYSTERVIARTRKELVLAGPNLRNWLSKAETRQQLVDLAEAGSKVTFVLGTYETLEPVSEEGALHLHDSVVELKAMVDSLSPNQSKRITAHFHRGASTLSAVFVDPSEDDALLFFSPRWAIQFVPADRFTCVIDRTINNDGLYTALYGGVTLMSQADAKTIDQMLAEWEERR